jgi:hypothetical protein
MDPQNTIFDRVDEVEANLRRLSTDSNLFVGISYAGDFDGRTGVKIGCAAQLSEPEVADDVTISSMLEQIDQL